MSGSTRSKSGVPVGGPRLFSLKHMNQLVMVPAGTLTIGRRASCDIVIDNKLVSREHARIIVGEQSAAVEDLGSSNGVLVNGRPIRGLHRLSPGDHIEIGHQLIEVIGFRDRTKASDYDEPETTTINGIQPPRVESKARG